MAYIWYTLEYLAPFVLHICVNYIEMHEVTHGVHQVSGILAYSGYTGLHCICLFVCWSLTSLCHSNGHIETMPTREINPFTALTRIRSQFLRTQWSTSNHSEWTRLRIRPLSHRGWLHCICSKCTISCICMRWGLYFAFRSLHTCTEWHLSLGLHWGYVGLHVAYVLIRRHHVFRLGSLIGLRSGGASRLAWCLGSSWFVCWSLTSLCHSNGHIETMPAREINPLTALTRIRGSIGELSYSNWMGRTVFMCDTIYQVNRRSIVILFILN